jgi:hypothetical protein
VISYFIEAVVASSNEFSLNSMAAGSSSNKKMQLQLQKSNTKSRRWRRLPLAGSCHQGDQMGRSFAYWAAVYLLWAVFLIAEVAQILGLQFSMVPMYMFCTY